MSTKKSGIFFNEIDIRNILNTYADWVDIVPNQTFCADNIMSDQTPIGTSIIIGIDGIKSEENSNILYLVLSSGIYELPIETTKVNDFLDIRFDKTIPIQGTFGTLEDTLDILTSEEKTFKAIVETLLSDRDDEYSQAFRKDNIRNIGGRGLILLEKIKNEIKSDDTLTSNHVTPSQLISIFIELTNQYVKSEKELEEWRTLHGFAKEYLKEEEDLDSKEYKKLLRDLENIERKIATTSAAKDFYKQTIDCAVTPILLIQIDR